MMIGVQWATPRCVGRHPFQPGAVGFPSVPAPPPGFLRCRSATERRGGVTIVDSNDHTHERAGHDEHREAPWTVVMPPFLDENAGASQLARFEKGTMHPKLCA